MLVNKLCSVVNFVVDHHEQVLLSVVLGNILICVLLLISHLEGVGGNAAVVGVENGEYIGVMFCWGAKTWAQRCRQ